MVGGKDKDGISAVKQLPKSWHVSFSAPDPVWDAYSLLDMRRVDPESWIRFVKLFEKFSTLLPDESPESGTHALELTMYYYERLYESYMEALSRLSKAWSTLHDKWMEFLDKIFGQKCLSYEPVSCLMSLSLLSPRHLDQRKFSVPFYIAIKRQLFICAHETFHYRYFEWLAQNDPKIPRHAYDSPHHAWRVSEVIASAVSNDPFVTEIFGTGSDDCYACSKSVFLRVLKAWREHQQVGTDFKQFYDIIYQLVPYISLT
jgi:hypothetical protein